MGVTFYQQLFLGREASGETFFSFFFLLKLFQGIHMNGMREKERGVEAKLKSKTLERKKNSDVTTKKNSDISSRDLIKKMSLKYFRI